MKQGSNQLKAGIILNYVNLGIGNLIPIFYTPIMLNLLGQSEYGLYKLSSSVTSYLSLISMGIGSAVTRYLIKANTEDGKEAEQRVLGLFVIIFQFIAAATFIVGCLLAINLDIWYANSLTPSELWRMKILVFILVCNTALSFSLSPYVSIVSTHERFVFLQCMNIMTTCVGPLLNLVALFIGYASIGMAMSTLFIGLITNLCYLCYVRKCLHIKAQYKKLPTHLLKEMLTFSFWVFVANIVGQLYGATDTVMIGANVALGTVGVAVYNIGGTFNSIMQSMTFGISNIFSTRTNKMVFAGASNRELTDFAARIGRLQEYIAALIASGFVAFGQPFIRFYAGSGYEAAYWVAVVMMVPSMIPLAQSVCLSIIVAQNRHRFRSLVYLGIAIGNVIGTWFLMQKMGVVGAALMTGIALVIGQGFVMNWYYDKKIHLEIKRFWKQICPIFVIPTVLCVITLSLYRWVNFDNLFILFGGIACYTVAYALLNWHFVMNDYEKSLISGPIKKIIRR